MVYITWSNFESRPHLEIVKFKLLLGWPEKHLSHLKAWYICCICRGSKIETFRREYFYVQKLSGFKKHIFWVYGDGKLRKLHFFFINNLVPQIMLQQNKLNLRKQWHFGFISIPHFWTFHSIFKLSGYTRILQYKL